VRILHDFSLKLLNSFGFDAKAKAFIKVCEVDELIECIHYAKSQEWPWFIIGGGSNVVIHDHLPGLTIQMGIQGRVIVDETSTHVLIDVGAGENWHAFVQWTLDQELPGLENLALIPGTCGAAPIQNIGAYGAEVENFIDSVEVVDIASMDVKISRLSHQQCHFSYRHSIFKDEPGRYIVTRVRFALPKHWQPNLKYAELASQFQYQASPKAKDIFDAVCDIRTRKLPDPKELGNAGSFFHNPVVDETAFLLLKERFPSIVAFPYTQAEQTLYKLAAGWLIDQCGFKGYRQGNVGVYDKQALVLVHFGGASGKDILELARIIKEKIHAVYGVDLIQEPINLPS
jgi:UDP-N-acetylmuramate dehydrogenase